MTTLNAPISGKPLTEIGTMAADSQYVPISDTDWICKASGSSSNWTLIPDDSSLSDSQVSNTVTVSDEDGLNAQTLYHDSATGNWYNIAGGIYTDNGDGTFTGSDGAIWTVTP